MRNNMTYTEYLELQKNIKEHPESFIDYERMIEAIRDPLEWMLELIESFDVRNETDLAEVIDVEESFRWKLGWSNSLQYSRIHDIIKGWEQYAITN